MFISTTILPFHGSKPLRAHFFWCYNNNRWFHFGRFGVALAVALPLADQYSLCTHASIRIEYKQFSCRVCVFMCLCSIWIWFHAVRRADSNGKIVTLMNSLKEPFLLPSLHLFFIKDQIKTNKKNTTWKWFFVSPVFRLISFINSCFQNTAVHSAIQEEFPV